MLADLNTRATGLGKFFNNNIMNSIADGGTAVVNDGRIEAISATGSYTGNNAFNPYGADVAAGQTRHPAQIHSPGYQLVNGVCQLIDDVTQDPQRLAAPPVPVLPVWWFPDIFRL